MKKFSKILIFTLSLVIALSAFAIASSADSSPFLVEGLYRENWEEAIDNAYIDGDREIPVELLRDYEVSDGESVEITESVVIALNGHTLKSETGEALFNVSGKDTVLKIVGPGTISVNGTLANVASGTLLLDAEETVKIKNSDSASVFVIGEEEKGHAKVLGSLEFETTAGSNLFELTAGSDLSLDGSSIKINSNATEASGVALAGSNAKINLKNASVSNNGGYIFALSEGADAEYPASISCENSTLVSDSSLFGSIVAGGMGHASVSFRLCDITASGPAFSSDLSLSEYEGEGKYKVYAKPILSVSLAASTFSISTASETGDASLFYGNVTGIVTGSTVNLTTNASLAVGTRLWDGECGVILKAGTKLSHDIATEITEPLMDADGVVVYFSLDETAKNKNFSLDTIDGIPCRITKTTEVKPDFSLKEIYLVSTESKLLYVDTAFSKNFEEAEFARSEHENSYGSFAGVPIATNGVDSKYGSVSIEQEEKADGSTNKYYKWEYDKTKKDVYPMAGSPYLELDAGGSGGVTSDRPFAAMAVNDFITWDFDIACSNGNYSYASIKIFARESTGSYAYTDTVAYVTGNKFKVGTMTADLSTTPLTWTHITLLFEMDNSDSYIVEGKTYYPNLHKSKLHAFVNGEFLTTVNAFSAALDTEKGLKGTSELSLDSIRFNLSAGTSIDKNTSTSLCFDNNIVTYYADGYVGGINTVVESLGSETKLNLSAADDTVYGITQKTGSSESTPVAKVDGIDYYDMNSALAAISEGSVAYLYEDVESVFSASSSFTVYTEHKFNVVSNSHYLSELLDDDNNVIGYRISPANKFVTVLWYVDMITETKVPLGIVPSYEGDLPAPYFDDDGRYVEMLGWSEDKNAKLPDAEIGKITKEDLAKGYKVYYPVYAATKIQVDFMDSEGEKISGGVYAEGETPVFDGEIDGYEDEFGRYISVIGWSTDKDATVPDAEIPAVTKADLENGRRVYYPVYAPTKVFISFKDNDDNTLYEGWFSKGDVPGYDGEMEGGFEDGSGRYISIIGWSETKNSDVVGAFGDGLRQQDLDGGHMVLYPVYDIAKVTVNFLDNNGNPVASEWVTVGTDLAGLLAYNDGSSLAPVDSGNEWYLFKFSEWTLEGGASEVGTDPISAIPVYTIPVPNAIKYSYAIERLTSIAPMLYVLKPEGSEVELLGFSFSGSATELLTSGVGDVTIGGKTYKMLDTTVLVKSGSYMQYVYSGMSNTIDKNLESVIYVHYKYDSEPMTEKVVCSFNDFLEKSLLTASESDKAPVMETIRLADAYLKLAGVETLPVCEKYLADEAYTQYLYDYTKASDLISDSVKSELDTNLYAADGLFAHFEKTVRWNFLTNTVYFSPITTVHQNITNGYSPATNLGDFFHASTNNRCDTTLYKTTPGVVYYVEEGASSAGTLRGGISGTFVLRLNTATYGVKAFNAIGGNDKINVKFQAEDTRKDMFIKYYSVAAHIIELERRVAAGEEGLEEELKMAQIIYCTQYSYAEASMTFKDGKYNLAGLWD